MASRMLVSRRQRDRVSGEAALADASIRSLAASARTRPDLGVLSRHEALRLRENRRSRDGRSLDFCASVVLPGPPELTRS